MNLIDVQVTQYKNHNEIDNVDKVNLIPNCINSFLDNHT